MEYQSQLSLKKGSPLPKRGQVKTKIIAKLVRSISSVSSKNRRERRGEDDTELMMPTSSSSGYVSEDG
ncbi:hypothetical protein IEQ34_005497 [Dendrobium chrysotoxum]|uniref:Uncharacterized protein n=1 Tax=Dendrobium chrysotoxum TaxID=161865 RepID=A0AAV7HCF1_DENCH|nr:hypothetical protein IEQ34_005497 [Dendrobium chrysotoxum]